MYLGFLSLYLITSDVTMFYNLKPPWMNQLLDVDGNITTTQSFCYNKPCIVKCCDCGEVLDDVGHCVNATKFEEYAQKLDFTDIHVSRVDPFLRLTETNQSVDTYFLYEKDGNFLSLRHFPEEFYVLEDGSLKMKVIYPTTRWIERPTFSFCMDLALNFTTSEQKHLPVVFKLRKHDQEMAQAYTNQRRFVILGLVISLVPVMLLCCLSGQVRNTIRPIVLAVTFTAAAGHTLKTLQLYAPSADVAGFGECRLFSPVYYLMILSNFFWANILIFDLWRRIRNIHNPKHDFYRRDYTGFVVYCLWGWGVPLLMTLVAVTINNTDMNKVLTVVKPPFESCFKNESATLLYLHVPIAALTIAYCVLLTIFIYNVVIFGLRVYRSPQSKDTANPKYVTTKLKLVLVLQAIVCVVLVYVCVGVRGALPLVALAVFTAQTWLMVYVSYVLDKSTLVNISQSFKSECHLSVKLPATKFVKQITKTTSSVVASVALVERLKKGDDTERMIDKARDAHVSRV